MCLSIRDGLCYDQFLAKLLNLRSGLKLLLIFMIPLLYLSALTSLIGSWTPYVPYILLIYCIFCLYISSKGFSSTICLVFRFLQSNSPLGVQQAYQKGGKGASRPSRTRGKYMVSLGSYNPKNQAYCQISSSLFSYLLDQDRKYLVFRREAPDHSKQPTFEYDFDYSMKSEVVTNYQKKIKDYVISYCPSEFYGINIHGEMRSGYQHNQNKIIMFRIVELPLTPNNSVFLELQQHYSDLSGFCRTIYPPVHSSSNHYLPLEFFPKTFNTQKQAFKTNNKYMDEYIEKFLRVYAFFYNMRVAHGNLTLHNIGITFDGKVKLMDFAPNTDNIAFEERAQKDFEQFKHGIGLILEKDQHFPTKFASFNNQKTCQWEHLFGLWHITSPLEPLYLPRKSYVSNIVTLLYKLESVLEEKDAEKDLRISLRLLMLKYLEEGKDEYEDDRKELQEIVGKLHNWDCDKMNGVLMGAIQDPEYYKISAQERLILICSLIPQLNHEYALFDVVEQFNSSQNRRNQLLGDSLMLSYFHIIRKNLLPVKL